MSSLTGKLRVQPLSAPVASPLSRLMTQLCNGQVTLRSCTMPSLNGPFLFKDGGTPAEYSAGLDHAISQGWLWKHESGTYVRFTLAGAELFACKRPPTDAAHEYCTTS